MVVCLLTLCKQRLVGVGYDSCLRVRLREVPCRVQLLAIGQGHNFDI